MLLATDVQSASDCLVPWNQLSLSDPLEYIMTVAGFMTSATGLHTEDMVDEYEL